MKFEMSRKNIILIAVVIVIVAAAAYYVVNYNSRIVVTNSMSGDSHPDCYYECSECGYQTIDSTGTCENPNCSGTGQMEKKGDLDIGVINVNDVVFIHKMSTDEAKSLHAGDVISFYNTSTHLQTIHRIVCFHYDASGNFDGYVTKGDNATTDPAPATFGNIEGKVVSVSPFMGKVVSFAKDRTLLLVCVIIILIVIVSVIRDMVIMARNDRRNREQ